MATMLCDEIAEKLDAKIRQMEVGEKLPSERELSEELHASRNMIRESLRVLREKGRIEILPGKGAYISNKQERQLESQLAEILFHDPGKLMDIVEVREELEMGIYLKAVREADTEDIRRLEEIYDRMEANRKDVYIFNEYDMKFHLQIAEASHNSIYPTLISALYHITEQKLFRITEMYPTRVDSAQREHRGLIEAIKSRDRKAAKTIAHKHFNIRDILASQNLENGRG